MNSQLNIILGSQSPRRKELLAGLDLPFTTKVIPGLEETYPDTLKGEEIPVYLAEQKADAYTLSDNELLITADTIVWLESKVYGKPKDEAEACEMLRSLSGKTHEVITGVCLRTNKKNVSFASTTKVTFAQLTEEEIDYYGQSWLLRRTRMDWLHRRRTHRRLVFQRNGSPYPKIIYCIKRVYLIFNISTYFMFAGL